MHIPNLIPEYLHIPWPSIFQSDSTIVDKLPHVTMSTFIGITVAISGNILISLALNLQKLAHRRLEAEKVELAKASNDRNNKNQAGVNGTPGRRRANFEAREVVREDEEEDDEGGSLAGTELAVQDAGGRNGDIDIMDTEPLLAGETSSPRDYGVNAGRRTPTSRNRALSPPRTFISRFLPFRSGNRREPQRTLLPVDVTTADELHEQAKSRRKHKKHSAKGRGQDGAEDHAEESRYLKSKLWWSGFLLMNVGEMGNFISYAFAPASVVAPLGTFALIANCIFAPVMLHERFRTLDIFGVFVAIVGAITVVLSSNTSDTKLDPEGLIKAISQHVFIAYSILYAVGAVILAGMSHGEAGRKWVFVDVGLCALFGGFTVLSTKGVSTLLTTRGLEMFAEWISYPLIVVLVATGVGQIRYLNRALMRFDSKVVIPIQFVLFNLSAIVGSAILYGDFRRATFHEMVTFLYGCAATFAGVFIIAWAPATDANSNDIDAESEAGADAQSENGVDRDSLFGSVGRRGRATLVLPSGMGSPQIGSPVLRHKPSSVGLMGLSPAQGLLLVHTPPHEGIPLPPRSNHPHYTHPNNSDPDRVLDSPDITRRRRAISWVGEEVQGRNRSQERRRMATMYGGSPTQASPRAGGTRESSLARNGGGR
ncbi:hypothetical protein JAAARDRAFT_52643 [Jaapia argillacea MUCL 33604]|uniref:DUF803-domain-containing protein n=1 Tax=Jaapia argillacea MUCL 33604 TaxID=933084 RepID=A0A067QET4_9AGAM|nr:hypothetical protein JAAARDRAFT_52643 [Jaapia argillacea MUCL 33604]